jgi:hypothetical protein
VRQQLLLARELAVLEQATAALPLMHPDDWQGRSRILFEGWDLKLRMDADGAIGHLRAALRLTSTAVETVRDRE